MSMKDSSNLKDLAFVGVDIGKDTFHLMGFDGAGELVLRKKIKRLALNQTFEKLPQCIVGMEACLSAHFVSRTLRGLVVVSTGGQLSTQPIGRLSAGVVNRLMQQTKL